MTTRQQTRAEADAEYEAVRAELARRDFGRFLGEARLIDPPPAGAGIVPFERWPHLMDLAAALTTERLLVVLKARQLGVSWLLAAYALWTAAYQQGAVVLLLSKGQHEATDLLGKCRTIHQYLPRGMQRAVGKDNSETLEFPAQHSVIHAYPSTPDAGRSVTATLVVQDEADFHEYLEANYYAVKPTVDAGGQLVVGSTSNKLKMLSLFKSLYREAPENGFARRFYGWGVRPGRGPEWYERVKANVPATEGLSPDQFMEQEYPGSEEEALAPSVARAFFDRLALVDLLRDCMEPKQAGMVRVWEEPRIGLKYVVGADTAWGQGSGSRSVAVVLDWATGVQVAAIYGRPEPDELAQMLVELCRKYNQAYLVLERAGEGADRSDPRAVVVVDKVVDLGYGDRMYHAGEHWRREARYRGWHTTPQTRPVMLGELEEAVRQRALRVRDRDGVGELMSFIRNEKGRAEAAEGAKDDYVMALAMAWQGRKYAKFRMGSGPAFADAPF